MKTLHSFLAGAALASVAMGAWGQTVKPGLWEFTTQMTGGSGEMALAMAQAQKQMASLPPEQRKMMEDMMAKQGIQMGVGAGGGTTLKMCLTPEMVERNDVATQRGDCTQTTSPRSGNTMGFSFVCTNPPSSGEGQVTFASNESYSMKMTANTTVKGKPEKMVMDSTGKFLSADCGSVKPINLPKK